jgi:hypothetical protein
VGTLPAACVVSHLLYSTNTYLKFFIQEKFLSDTHYVWCSECFDSKKLSAYLPAARVAPSSNPADIFRELRRDIDGRDRHSYKINSQKATLQKLALDWQAAGQITDPQRDEIIYITQHATFEDWRPLVYVIPTAPVSGRLQLVPIDKRAGFGDEYIIPDLRRSEFDILEF